MKGHRIRKVGKGRRPIKTLNVLVRKDMMEYEVTKNKALIGLFRGGGVVELKRPTPDKSRKASMMVYLVRNRIFCSLGVITGI